jgi:Viral BACON domain/von Willebrand factor type A domain
MVMSSTARSRAVRRGARYLGQAALLLVVLATVGCPPQPVPGSPDLQATPIAFVFQPGETAKTLVLTNNGSGIITWTVTDVPGWLTVTPSFGALALGTTSVELSVDRTTLVPGSTMDQFGIVSTGGTQTIAVTAEVTIPANLDVLAPAAVDFGDTSTTESFSFRNTGEETLNWELTVPDTATWITNASSADGGTGPGQPPLTGTTIAGATTTITLTATRGGLVGPASTDLVLTSDGGDATVPATITIPGPTPLMNVTPTNFVLGARPSPPETFSVQNLGTADLTWTLGAVEYAQPGVAWLTAAPVAPIAAIIPGGSADVTLTVDRTGLADGDYGATVPVTDTVNGVTANVTVSITKAGPVLIVAPTTLRFGSFTNTRILSISNGGEGDVHWSVDMASLPTWISLSAPTSGIVTDAAVGMEVTVTRSGPARDDEGFITFSATDGGGAPLPGDGTQVRVLVTIPPDPLLNVIADVAVPPNPPNVETYEVRFGSVSGVESREFIIENLGTGELIWAIDDSNFEENPWLLSVSELDGRLEDNERITIMATVSSEGLFSGPYEVEAMLTTNDRDVLLNLSMQVPLREAVIVDPPERAILPLDNNTRIFVGNSGDFGTLLRFLVTPDGQADWLFLSPVTGVSIGSDPIDFQTINLAVDRYALRGIGDSAVVTAYAVDELGQVKDDITPDSSLISVELSQLTFDNALARMRVPSLVRWTFVMHNIRDEGFAVDPAVLDPPGSESGMKIFEDDVLIDYTETNQFVVDATRLRVNIAILLDYSLSMVEAADMIDPGNPDALQELFERVITEFLRENDPLDPDDDLAFLRPNYRVALMEFHDRSQPARMLQDFTEDWSLVTTTLDNVNDITDFGATPLLPAVEDAAAALVAEDSPNTAFDDADVRAIFVLTDGKRTTPPGQLQETVDLLKTMRVSVFAVGWGADVDSEPLARLANGTGGHYYPTLPELDGTPTEASLVNPLNVADPQPVPLFEDDVDDYNEAEDLTIRPGKIQLLRQDLSKFMALQYAALNEDRSVPVRVDVGFDPDPADGLDRQLPGSITEQTIDFESFSGDSREGQIEMRTSGIQGGAARVYVRCEYTPRNINALEFTIAPSIAPDSITVIPESEGGLIEAWTSVAPINGGTHRYEAPAGEALPYGTFGDLLRLDFTTGLTSFTVDLAENMTDIAAAPVLDPKTWDVSTRITVDAGGMVAPALPLIRTLPVVLDFGDSVDASSFTMLGTGLFLISSLTQVDWAIVSAPAWVDITDPATGLPIAAGAMDATTVTQTLDIEVDRTFPSGTYYGLIYIGSTSPDIAITSLTTVGVRMTIP